MRLRPRLAALATLATLVASCGGSGGELAGPGPTATVAADVTAGTAAATDAGGDLAATGAPSPGSGAASSSPTETDEGASGEPAFSSKIIETPAEILNGPPPSYTRTPDDFSIVAEAVVPRIDVYADWNSPEPFTALANPLPSGSKLTFLVDGQTPERAQVLVPIHPPDGSETNEVTGWIPLSQVETKRNDYKIVINLADYRLTVFKGAGTLMSVPVGVGTEATPTPGGRYYIKELIKPLNPKTKKYDPTGVYGPYAYGLSGYSQIYDADNPFNGGDGQLGIHGTNEPELIGTNVSHGCIRVSNDDIVKMRAVLPLGTPVVVNA